MKELSRFRQFLTEGVIKEDQISPEQLEGMGYSVGEKALMDIDTEIFNHPNFDSFVSGFMKGFKDNLEASQDYAAHYFNLVNEGVIKENMSLEVDKDFIELSADSGDYDGDLNDDGTVDFSVVYDDGTEFDDSTWKSILGPKHAFVEIASKIPTKVEAAGDYVMITVDLEDLKKLLK